VLATGGQRGFGDGRLLAKYLAQSVHISGASGAGYVTATMLTPNTSNLRDPSCRKMMLMSRK